MRNKTKGLLCAIFGPVLWGISGNVAQYLFAQPGIRPAWLVAVRLLGAGAVLMIYCLFKEPAALTAIARDCAALLHTAAFGLLGVLVSQFTYFSAVAASNAPTTTVLQYLGPVFIIVYLALRHREWPRRVDVLSILLAFIGIFFLVTHGRFDQLSLTPAGLLWGIGAGLGAALYTLLPGRLLVHFRTEAVLAWAMLIAGLAMSPLLFTAPVPRLTWPIIAGIVYVTLGGTLFAYLLYVASLRYLRPTTVGLLNIFEPLTATVVSVLCFHTSFAAPELFGGLLVLSTTFLQTLPTRHHQQVKKRPHQSKTGQLG